ncbi:MAG TPA: hypothetical protein PKM65_18535 [Spirochaetota bacterium]|nr:hypothetical protein [Spirochaetota bacterium]HNT13048.1 hypothetical protein [Spirochaetota bacterium]HOS39451.1 hypothetical protein [Spirochaetota bacterium]HPU89172.1 hypothetical protein [Spirochaetota bacterium]
MLVVFHHLTPVDRHSGLLPAIDISASVRVTSGAPSPTGEGFNYCDYCSPFSYGRRGLGG